LRIKSDFGQEWAGKIFQANGYSTAGFVGIDLLGGANRFNVSFQVFDEPIRPPASPLPLRAFVKGAAEECNVESSIEKRRLK